MFRKLLAVLGFALPVFSAQAAHADWLIVSAYDFQPTMGTTDYRTTGGRGGYIASGFPVVKAPVRIPIGKSFRSLWCQVLDASTTKDISITFGELASADTTAYFGERTMLQLSTTGATGHQKINGWFTAPSVARTFECNGDCWYYSYYLTASLPEGTNTHIKSCAVEYY
jgi:hypothetical protein